MQRQACVYNIFTSGTSTKSSKSVFHNTVETNRNIKSGRFEICLKAMLVSIFRNTSLIYVLCGSGSEWHRLYNSHCHVTTWYGTQSFVIERLSTVLSFTTSFFLFLVIWIKCNIGKLQNSPTDSLIRLYKSVSTSGYRSSETNTQTKALGLSFRNQLKKLEIYFGLKMVTFKYTSHGLYLGSIVWAVRRILVLTKHCQWAVPLSTTLTVLW